MVILSAQTRMFSVLLVSLLSCLAVSFPLRATEAETLVLGDALTQEATLSIAALLEDPDAFAGKTVRVEGTVKEVCPRKGCWIEVEGADEAAASNFLRIKVEDGVIVFPQDSRGRHVVAEGIVEIVELERDQYLNWARHQADEKGEAFDPDSVGAGPFRWVQLKGLGAELRRP